MKIRYGIYLTFDSNTQTKLQQITQKMVDKTEGLSEIKGKMQPHLSLLIFDDDNSNKVLEKFAKLLESFHSFALKLESIDSFDNKNNKVIYAKPIISEELKNIYMQCLDIFSDSDINQSYKNPNLWKPHITLAKRMNPKTFKQAKTIAQSQFYPINANVNGIGIINVQKPLEPLAAKYY